jgi:isopenicillin-N epimerase
VASCHKWLCAPCGTGFLYARKKHQSQIFHPVVSWGRSVSGQADSWKDSFTWPGTFDPAPFMSIPSAIQFMHETVGLITFRQVTHELAKYASQKINELTGLTGMYDNDSNWYGPMVTLPLPDNLLPAPQRPAQKHQLQHQLQEQFGIEIPIIHFQGKMWIRVSCHLYNNKEQIDYLVSALNQLIK